MHNSRIPHNGLTFMGTKTDNSSLTLFLSHAHIDSDVAAVLHRSITDAFGGLVTFFRSSATEGSIEIGDSIKQTIKQSLAGCAAAVTLLSHSSVNRPWINIEFGALWMLDATIIPVCFPDLKPGDLPFNFSDIKMCSLGSPSECISLVSRINKLVSEHFPFRLKQKDISRHGKTLYKNVSDTIKSRLTTILDEPPLQLRTTVWALGSYSELSTRERTIAEKLIQIFAQGLVNLGVRLVSGESDLLVELAGHYRKAAIASQKPVPSAIMLFGKLRQRDPKKLFMDAIGLIPDLAVVIGGSTSRNRVEQECQMAAAAGIPLLPVPAAGGAAINITPTADKASDIYGLLKGTDIGDVSKGLLQAVERYNPRV